MIYADPPQQCDVCRAVITTVFYDARLTKGIFALHSSWGNVCETCFNVCTDGKLGIGIGQKYELQPDGKFHKSIYLG